MFSPCNGVLVKLVNSVSGEWEFQSHGHMTETHSPGEVRTYEMRERAKQKIL